MNFIKSEALTGARLEAKEELEPRKETVRRMTQSKTDNNDALAALDKIPEKKRDASGDSTYQELEALGYWALEHRETLRQALQQTSEACEEADQSERPKWQDIEGVQGETPSQQIGGCDYMSLKDARKLCSKYILKEMRDPCGLNEDAKAMLTLLRNIPPTQEDE